MRFKLFVSFFLSVCPALIHAQEVLQDVRGIVTNAAGLPVAGATVMIGNDGTRVATADSAGKFRIMRVPVGRYTVKISQLGYRDAIIPGLVIDAGKEPVLEVILEENTHALEEVEVNATSSPDHLPNTRTFTVEETKRFAATFNDPARLAASFPGVISDNDQANNIVIRGNSPNGVLWRLEGLDIVSPNHLDNAGTFSDRAAMNGGGVNILSAQLLDNSQLITGAFAAGYGNALSGVFNMKLRKGNNEHNEFTGQISLLGTDLAAEGPLSKKRTGSYLVNYRYSTLGMLSALGLDFGNEVTTFQDLSFHISLPTSKAGSFSLFGLGGASSTLFNAQMDSTIWEYSRDRYDVDFYSKTGAIGLSHSHAMSGRLFMRSVIGISSKLVTRIANWIDNNYALHALQEDRNLQSKLSAHSFASYSISSRNTITAGINANELFYDISYLEGSEAISPQTMFTGEGHYTLLQPYLSWRSALTERVMLNAGLHYVHLSLNNSSSIEPRVSVLYDLKKERTFSLAYGRHSQVQQPGVFFVSLIDASGDLYYPNRGLGFTRADHYSAAYSSDLLKGTRLKLETYYQYLFDVPVPANTGNTFSMLNTLETFAPVPMVNKGTGKNYGIELAIEKTLSDRYYFLLSSTIYESRYTAADGIERSTRYNGRYAFSFSGGKEMERSRNRVLGINLRAIYRGGYREIPIDESLSAAAAQTVFVNNELYSIRQKDYFRIDIRISSKKQKRNYTRTFALDIQNATNAQNEAYRYYDTFRKEIVTRYQLGIIPVLSYRAEFGTKKKE